MNLITQKDPKYLANYVFSRVCNLYKSYRVIKSPKENSKTKYIKSSDYRLPSIRISDHTLDPKFHKNNSDIDVIISEHSFVTINGVVIQSHIQHSYKSVVADYILAIIAQKPL